MMVGDDQIDPKLPAERRLGIGGDAAVNGDDELHALLFERVDGERVQAVALLQPRGNIAGHMSAEPAQKLGHQAGRRDAVHVIVAEHADMLLFVQRPLHARAGRLHVEQLEGVAQGPVAREKLPRQLLRVVTAAAQDRGGDGGIACTAQALYVRLVFRARNGPGSVLHFRYTSNNSSILSFPLIIASLRPYHNQKSRNSARKGQRDRQDGIFAAGDTFRLPFRRRL